MGDALDVDGQRDAGRRDATAISPCRTCPRPPPSRVKATASPGISTPVGRHVHRRHAEAERVIGMRVVEPHRNCRITLPPSSPAKLSGSIAAAGLELDHRDVVDGEAAEAQVRRHLRRRRERRPGNLAGSTSISGRAGVDAQAPARMPVDGDVGEHQVRADPGGRGDAGHPHRREPRGGRRRTPQATSRQHDEQRARAISARRRTDARLISTSLRRLPAARNDRRFMC